MLKTCLDNKEISDFLNLYDQSRWGKLIPSLLEIAILNLKFSFHKLIFSEKDIHNIIIDLKFRLSQPISSNNININNNNNYMSNNKKRNIKKNIWSYYEWKTFDKMSKSDYFKNNRYNELGKSSNKNFSENFYVTDKNEYFKNLKLNGNKLAKSYTKKEKINYAISYDKDLNPELIERTFLKKNKNKKGGKKIIQKMTKEEYDKKYFEEKRKQEQNKKNYEKKENKVINKNREQKNDEINNNYNSINGKNKKFNNNLKYNKKGNYLYHYTINNINNHKNNTMIQRYNKSNINKSNSNYNKINDVDIINNSQKSYENKYFTNKNLLKKSKNNKNKNTISNIAKNNYINIEINPYKNKNNNNNKFINNVNNRAKKEIKRYKGQLYPFTGHY